MVFAALSTSNPHIRHRAIISELGALLGERKASFRYQPSTLADWLKNGYEGGTAHSSLQSLELTPTTREKVLGSITRYVKYLREPSFEEHWETHSEAYIAATHLLLGTDGEVLVDRFYVWVEPDNPVMSPHIVLARHLNIPCINLGDPKTRAKMEDWVMHHSLTF